MELNTNLTYEKIMEKIIEILHAVIAYCFKNTTLTKKRVKQKCK